MAKENTNTNRPRVVIVGAGFGGLWAAKTFQDAPVDVTLLDRHNYHTFMPLLYQVAAAEIEPAQIGYPVRTILRDIPNVRFKMAEVVRVDPAGQTVHTTEETLPYDYLILATGSVSRYFGIPGAEKYGFSLKTMEEGIIVRNHILTCLEHAAQTDDAEKRRQLLTFVIVGGGATGVEYAGALAELIYGPVAKDFPQLDMNEAQIILIEAQDNLLTHLPHELGEYAIQRLTKMGVTLQLETFVEEVTANKVRLREKESVPTNTVVWTAGVGGEPVAQNSPLDTATNGRLPVTPTLQLADYANIYAVGDLAVFETETGEKLPMVAPVATQQGKTAAQNIIQHMANQPQEPFVYHDRGAMSSIGRNAAVAYIRGRKLKGFVAWWIWLIVHLFNLIGFRNRIMVFINWAWTYLFFEYMVRLIVPGRDTPKQQRDSNFFKVGISPND